MHAISSMRRALVMDPDAVLRRSLSAILVDHGYEPVVTATAEEARSALATGGITLALLNPDLVLGEARDWFIGTPLERGQPRPVVVLLGPPDSRLGLPENLPFVERTANAGQLREGLDSILDHGLATDREGQGRIVEQLAQWRSPQMRAVYEIVRQAARAKVTVLICGETGTGKDLVARAIHHHSPRRDAPFVKVNCAALPKDLLESELFGHERGAFTGAHQLKIGKFELANHGTIFLDEIGDLHPALQAKLLHVLEDGTFSRLGGRSPLRVDTCIIAATNQNLEQAVAQHSFRHDLYFRLNVVKIIVPPLRERREEIPFLAEYLVRQHAKAFHRENFTLDTGVLERLKQYHYPGNIRELENLVKRAIVLNDRFLTKVPFPPDFHASHQESPPPAPLDPERSLKDIGRTAARAAERDAIARTLNQTGWNRVRAAKILGISYRALLYKIKDAGLNSSDVG